MWCQILQSSACAVWDVLSLSWRPARIFGLSSSDGFSTTARLGPNLHEHSSLCLPLPWYASCQRHLENYLQAVGAGHSVVRKLLQKILCLSVALILWNECLGPWTWIVQLFCAVQWHVTSSALLCFCQCSTGDDDMWFLRCETFLPWHMVPQTMSLCWC